LASLRAVPKGEGYVTKPGRRSAGGTRARPFGEKNVGKGVPKDGQEGEPCGYQKRGTS